MNKKTDFSYENQVKLFLKCVLAACLVPLILGIVTFFVYHQMSEEERQKFLDGIEITEIPKEERSDYGYGSDDYSQAPWAGDSGIFEGEDGEDIILDNPVGSGSSVTPDVPEGDY